MIPMETTSAYPAVERILLPEDAVCLQHLVIENYNEISNATTTHTHN